MSRRGFLLKTPSLYWGPCCPQVVPRRDNDEIVFFGNPPAAEYREDCQRLNVWTPGLDHAKRPVLAAKMCDCWVTFARSGDPNHPGVPHWPVYDPQTVPTMIFDDVCTVENDQSAGRAG